MGCMSARGFHAVQDQARDMCGLHLKRKGSYPTAPAVLPNRGSTSKALCGDHRLHKQRACAHSTNQK